MVPQRSRSLFCAGGRTDKSKALVSKPIPRKLQQRQVDLLENNSLPTSSSESSTCSLEQWCGGRVKTRARVSKSRADTLKAQMCTQRASLTCSRATAYVETWEAQATRASGAGIHGACLKLLKCTLSSTNLDDPIYHFGLREPRTTQWRYRSAPTYLLDPWHVQRVT